MFRFTLFSLIAASALSLALVATAPTVADDDMASVDAEMLFAGKVLPMLREKCFACHGDQPDEIEGELNLLSRQGMLAGGESGEPALTPSDPAESAIYVAVTWNNGDLEMPPKENDRLSQQQIADLRRWIQAGAPWPDADRIVKLKSEYDKTVVGVAFQTSGGLTSQWTDRKYDPESVWAYFPVQRYRPPWKERNSQTGNAIDAFIDRRLNEKGIESAGPAERRTLIRRATFDLTGLPPTPDEVAAFLADDSPQAWQHTITRLLASPCYGEQWGRHWLDVVRYADSGGFANDYVRPNAWRYRDYVIRSFNRDKPYDRFIKEQIAGDELGSDPELLVAVGFLRMGPWEHTGMSVEAVTRQFFLDDVTNSVGETFLGLALRCAKCHDHKFDPLPTQDYYRIQAVFAPVQFADRRAKYLPAENTKHLAQGQALLESRIQRAQTEVERLEAIYQAQLAKMLKEKGYRSIDEIPKDQRPSPVTAEFFDDFYKSMLKINKKLIRHYQRERKGAQEIAFSVYNGPNNHFSSPSAMAPMPADRSGKLDEVHILQGGSIEAPVGDPMTPGVLSALYDSNDAIAPSALNTIPDSLNGRRLALANWLASPQNTLTARVIVNRVWQHHFAGRGLVATSNGFGVMGARPTHPELLDHLAAWFIDHGWSIKKLHRLIMSSAVYRRSGEHPHPESLDAIDPTNELLSFYPPRRLAAEELRDSMLAVSGEMNRERGGPGVFPEINWEVALQPRHIMGSPAPAYQPSIQRSQRHRRSIYAFRMRTVADPMLEVFNKPNADLSCERRDETTVTPQVFTLFNSQNTYDRAVALAYRLRQMHDDPAGQIEAAYQLVFSRPPTRAELHDDLAHVDKMTRHHRRHKPVVVDVPLTVQREMIEELTGKTLRWDEVLDTMARYERDLKVWDVAPEARALAELCLVLLNSNEFVYVY